jgi:6,7-dimethyl-8-ribityllumazine synthase
VANPASVAIVVSRYNASVTQRLLDGAIRECVARTATPPVVFDAPGAFELPILCMAAAMRGDYAGVLALGCIVRGDTEHDRYIAHAVAHGITEVTLATGVPVAFGVLTVNTPAQARDRAGGKKGNKGQEAMGALLDTIATLRAISGGPRRDPGGDRGKSPPRPDKLARTRRSPRTPGKEGSRPHGHTP